MSSTSDSDPIVISGVGAHTSFGGAADAAAAFRCGMSRGRELEDWPMFDQETLHEYRLIGHPAADMEKGFQGIGRYLSMLVSAATDIVRARTLDHINRHKLALILVLPPSSPNTLSPGDSLLRLLSAIQRGSGLEISPENTLPLTSGRIGYTQGLRHAMELLRRGMIDHALICSADSLLDRGRLERLLAEERVRTAERATGLFPGEAAVMLLLERSSVAVARGIVPLVQIAASIDREAPPPTYASAPPSGTPSSEIIEEALFQAGIVPATTGTIYSDLNGEEYRAADYGNAIVRCSPEWQLGSWHTEVPAISFGDTGASSGALASCMMVRSIARNYFQGETALFTLAGDEGGRGVAVMKKV